MSATVTVYTKPNCGSCVDTKELMNELGLEFAEVDISKDAVALKRLKSLGYRGAPVVVTPDTSWFGFNEPAIRDLASGEDAWDF